MFKRIFYHSLIAGILATVAALIYNRIYFFATEVDYSRIINVQSVAGLNMLVCFVAAFINWGVLSLLKAKGELFLISSFPFYRLHVSLSRYPYHCQWI